jgi:NDP-sugar pyrophosphorylase family protein
MDAIRLVVPMSGQGHRFRAAGYAVPKPLVPVAGAPMIERVLACFPREWPATLVLAENHRSSGLPETLGRLRPGSTVAYLEEHHEGPGRALAAALPLLPPDAPVFVSYCDYGMGWDPAAFERFVGESCCDACIVTYRGFHAHYLGPNTYAYARLDGERVVEVREKGSFTTDREAEHASAGGYFFRSAEVLRRALDAQARLGLLLNGESYTSLTVEALLRSEPGSHVRVFEVPHFFQWGTPEDVREFEFFEATMRGRNRHVAERPAAEQVLVPMAGRGTRFAGVTPLPKSLIPVAGRAMYLASLDGLPQAPRTVLVAMGDVAERIAPPGGTTVVALAEMPSGQALSAAAGLHCLDPDREVVVGACDHAPVIDPVAWARFRADPRCDAAILVARGLPAAVRTPRAFAWVVPAGGEEPFPEVASVSVKAPVSDAPWRDLVLVGSFWFRSADVLRRGIEELARLDRRVNGELYLDSVFDVIAGGGGRVRAFPLDGCLSFGDPDSLAEALYWMEALGGRRAERRARHPGVSP